MRTRERYTFELRCGNNTHIANPLYDKLSKKWQQESNQIFFRQSIDGQLQFVNDDYEFIRRCDMAEDIVLTIYRDSKKYIECYFRVADCDIDENHKSLKVKPKSRDSYNTILDKYNEEYDLLKQNPQLSDVSMDVRPTLQVYELGADYIDTYIGSSYYKKKVTPVYSLKDEFNFDAKTFAHCCIKEYDTSGEFGKDLLGNYIGLSNWTTIGGSGATAHFYIVKDDNPAYRILLDRYYTSYPDNTEVVEIKLQVYIGGDDITGDIQTSDEWRTIAQYYDAENNRDYTLFDDMKNAQTIPLYKNGELILKLENYNFAIVYFRLLYMNSNIESNIDEEDYFVFSEIYNHTQKLEQNNIIEYSSNQSSEETIYGKDSQTKMYYQSPRPETDRYVPILQDQWGNGTSLWLNVYEVMEMHSNLIVNKTLKDWVSLYETIRVLLKAIDPSINIQHGSPSSMFLFNRTNPLTNLSQQGEMFLLAKSNATTLEYDYSATKTPITLGKVLEWLKTMNIYWDIYELEDGRKIFRLEHLSYYLNGMNYSGNSRKIIDLKTIFDVRNGKHYAYRTNRWKYDISDSMPTTIFYKWAEEVSVPFEGKAMRAVKRLSDEKQETIGTDTFVSDIDYVFANSNEVSKDGFIVVQAYRADSTQPYAIKYYDCNIDGRDYKLQNGLLSALYIQKSYLPYNLAFRQAEVADGTIVDVKLMKKIRQNDIEFFVPRDMEIDEYTLLTTEVGNGTISDMTQEINSDKIKVTLKYPIDDEY